MIASLKLGSVSEMGIARHVYIVDVRIPSNQHINLGEY